MYLSLRPDVTLGTYEQKPCLFVDGATSFRISALSFSVLAKCDGTVTEQAVSAMVETELGLEPGAARDNTALVLTRYRQFVRRNASPIEAPVTVLRDRRPDHLEEKTMPGVIHWVVTEYCNRRCIYCIRNTKYGLEALDSAIDTQRAFEIIERCTLLGATRLYLDGGEPLLRPDLPQILNKTTECGATATMVTKAFVDRSLAQTLAAAGLEEMQYSLDSPSRRVADMLTGSAGFFDEAVASIGNLARAGIAVRLTSVVSHSTAKEFEALEKLAVELGCSSMILFRLAVSPLGRLTRPEHLTDEDHAVFDAWYQTDHRLPVEIVSEDSNAGREKRGCSVGRSCLVIAPNGDACLCDKLMPETAVGSLLDQQVEDIWFSERLTKMRYPSMSEFEGTRCYECRLFEDCNRQGRCVSHAYHITGKMNAPCRFCLDPLPKEVEQC